MRKIILIIVSVLTLTGCQQQPSTLAEYNPVVAKSPAVVVVKVDNVDYVNIKRLNTDPSTPDLNNEYTIDRAMLLPFNFKYSQAMYNIEPGTYYISFAYYSDITDDNYPYRYTQCPGLDCNNKFAYGAFTIEPDQILYLGDIKVDWLQHNPHKMFCMTDNIDAVKCDLQRAGLKDLAEKVQFAKWEH